MSTLEVDQELKEGIRKFAENLQSYPTLTADSDWGQSRADRSGPSGATPNLSRMVDGAMREVIGRVPSVRDPRSFVAALNQSFEIRQVEGHTEFSWNPRGYAGQTDLGGGVTGYQASLYTRGRDMLDKALPLLDGLYSLKTDTDKEVADAYRAMVGSSLQQLVSELGFEGGPRTARVEGLFRNSLDSLEQLKQVFGLNDYQNVNTTEEEVNYSSFIALDDYVTSLKSSWDNYSQKRSAIVDLGTGLTHLSRQLSVAEESVNEINWALDSVFIGEAERKVIPFGTGTMRMTLGDYLDWVSQFTTQEAPNLIHRGGKIGITQISKTAKDLQEILKSYLGNNGTQGRMVSDGISHPRVKRSIQQLNGHLGTIVATADDITVHPMRATNTLTVVFNTQGGSAISNGSTTAGGVITDPGMPTRPGYLFTGWSVSANGGTSISFPYTHNQITDFTLYAQWTPNKPDWSYN